MQTLYNTCRAHNTDNVREIKKDAAGTLLKQETKLVSASFGAKHEVEDPR